jgi:hypothetical protein
MSSKTIAPTDALAVSIVEFLANDLDTSSVVKAVNNWVDATLNGGTGGDIKQISSIMENLLGFAFT